MNRVKFWAYALVTLAAGAAGVVFLSRSLTERSLAQLDRELHSAVAQVDARSQLLVAETAQLADALVRDPALARALVADGGRDALEAAQSALQALQHAPAGDARLTFIAVGTKGGVVARSAGGPLHLDADGASLVASAGTRRAEGYMFVGDGLWYVVAVPANQGSSIAVGLPIDGPWLALVRTGTGCGATLLAEGHPPRTTLSGDDLATVLPVARASIGHPASAGGLPPQTTSLPLPAVSVPFVDAPAFRAQAVALRGLPAASILLSLPTAPLLAPVAGYLWLIIVGLGVLALLAVAVGFTISNEEQAMVPKELVGAADRIARGNFDARAPELAGSLGTVAAALNRAAEAAQARASAAVPENAASPVTSEAATQTTAPSSTPAVTPTPSPLPTPGAPAIATSTTFASAGIDAPVPAGDFDAVPVAERLADAAAVSVPETAPTEPAAAAAAVETPSGGEASPPAWSWGLASAEPATGQPLTANVVEPAGNGAAHADPFAGLPLEARASSEPLAKESRTEDFFPLPRAAQPASLADPVAAAPLAPEPPGAESSPSAVPLPAAQPPASAGATDEDHWRAIYADFLRVRAECGEGASALAFERFRQKLVKNREQLVEKYHCRTVKFQVYVKEGKAALKATPVR